MEFPVPGRSSIDTCTQSTGDALERPGDENLCLFFTEAGSLTQGSLNSPETRVPQTHPGVAGPELMDLGSLSLRKEHTVINTRFGLDVITYLERDKAGLWKGPM